MARCSSQTVQIVATAAILAWGLAPGRLALGTPGRLRETLRNDQLSQADYEKMERGYYEQILDAGRKLGASDAVEPESPRHNRSQAKSVPFEGGPLAQGVDDLREFVLKPNLSVDHAGARWTTNALGMRDRPYESTKPPNTLRIAFVGDSIGAGWGVGDGQAFEAVLERQLDGRSKAGGGSAVEILNFAIPGHGPGQRWEHFKRVGWATEPDLVLFESTQADSGWDERRLRGLLPRGIGWDSPMYRDVLTRAHARPGGTIESYKQVLRPYREEFAAGVFRTAAADCRARGVPIVLVMVPRVGKTADQAEIQRLIALARDAGFTAIVDLSDTYNGIDPKSLAVGPNDYHPNAKGHAMLAQRLDAALQTQTNLLRPPKLGPGEKGGRQ
ncbi:GDSL-like Lipase/Acylhydrolase family protein [Singulisphaera sp. GP187]|uniref:SGNH/GDSL hydrolase family protein n=1 Tax=Singulisphaera sp. GP187 TaxID=1882752 RepID=UPI00092C3E19|nr:SGNH/GDSL hydrolase family protein [Singulisphaera sp. GP187]SIO30993.1 GDSL-like Lipase/Acylhydrolase family protein [Singulisphaera sp. GP187]